jgi:hypothetical protein
MGIGLQRLKRGSKGPLTSRLKPRPTKIAHKDGPQSSLVSAFLNGLWVTASQAAEKLGFGVILSEAKNLSST